MKFTSMFWSQSNCQKRFNFKVTKNQVCFGEPFKDTCSGDSGGPVQCYQPGGWFSYGRWYQYGVTSFGVGECGNPKQPTIYARISELSEWIWKTIDAN